MKRTISLLMSFLIVLLMMSPIYTFAEDAPHKHYEDCTGIPEFYNATNQEALQQWNSIQSQLPSGTQPTAKGYPFNFRLWHDKHLVVYGNYASVNNGTKDWKNGTQPGGAGPIIENEGYYFNGARGEYRYHGFDAQGNKFTNADFIIDADLGEKLTDKDWIINPWDSSKVKPKISESLYNVSAVDRNNLITQHWINRAANFRIQGSTDNAYKYMHVLSAPTLQYPGQGRMWHLYNNNVWYQSFPVPKLDSTVKASILPTDINVSLVVNNKPSELSFIDYGIKSDSDIIKVKVTVTVALKDDTYISDPVEKTNHYTREDLKQWIISLNGEYKTVTLWSRNTGKADFEIPLTKAQIKALANNRYPLTGKGQAVFLDNTKSPERSTNGYAQFIINNEPAPPPPPDPISPPEPEQPPFQFEPAPDVPSIAFDIVRFPASDNTDMSKVSVREAYIDGVQIDDNTFFNGNYVFGENNEGLKKVTVNYTSIDGQKAQTVKWVLVYNTKPRTQFKIEGSYKQMRKLTITNTSLLANDQPVLDAYPITSYEWSYNTIEGDGSSLKIRGTSTALYKELMYKKPGVYQIVLRATNALGRVSDPYTLQFVIAPDIPPAIEICLDNSVIARNETLGAYHYSVSSTDGDIITANTIELWYDSNNDGIYDQLINSFNGSNGFPTYTPQKLGRYKYIDRVSEDFGQDTLSEFISPDDKISKTEETEFFVDNYIPMTDLYVDIPVIRPQIDVYFMLDANLDDSKTAYVLNNRMNFNNFLRSKNILPQINNWDMKTYTYTQSAYTSVHTGSSYPPSTTYYSSGGYSGTLNRTSVSDNGYNHDYGHYETRTDSKTATGTFSGGYASRTYRWNGSSWVMVSNTGTDTPSVSYNQDGYTGTLYKTGFTKTGESGSPPSNPKAGDTYTHTDYYTGYYSGTVTKQVTVWVSDWRWVSDYTGFYSGTIYNYVRQPYVDPFRSTSDKYIVYVSDQNISQLNDLQTVLSKCDGKLILIGRSGITSQISYEKFISNDRSIDQSIQAALDYISGENPAVPKYYLLANQDTFNMNTGNFDEENDPIVEEKFQYVQNPNYFDNPQGMDSFAVNSYSDTANWTDTKISKFNKTGEFRIYRRIKDKPSSDSSFANYSYYSGTPELIVYSHRKPIANATLTWDFDPVRNIYNTTWVDNSYDLDHLYNRPDKGIVDRKIMFRRNGGEWNYMIPDQLQYGSYELQYYVKDPEGVWSDPFTMNFTLNPAPPMQFDADLRTLDNRFSLTGIPASEYLEAYNVWTRFPYNVYLQMALYNGSTMVSPLKTVNYSTSTGEKDGNDINWNNINYQIPATLADGNYTFRITAIGDYGQNASREFPVTVSTPINLVGAINGSTTNAEIQADAKNTFTFRTAVYASSVKLNFKGQTYTSSSGLISLAGNDGTTKTWELKLNVPISTVTDNETGFATFTAYTPSGKSESVNVNYKVITIQAYDFTVTSILDINWRGYYFDLDNPINGDGETYGYSRKPNTDIKTLKMPINSMSFVPYPHMGVQAGCKVKGYIRVKGGPDSVNLIAKYQQDGTTKSSYTSLAYAGGDKYNFEWIIPQESDQETYICFSVEIRKGSSIYGNEKWIDTWPAGNSSYRVFFIQGKVQDSLRFNQSN